MRQVLTSTLAGAAIAEPAVAVHGIARIVRRTPHSAILGRAATLRDIL